MAAAKQRESWGQWIISALMFSVLAFGVIKGGELAGAWLSDAWTADARRIDRLEGRLRQLEEERLIDKMMAPRHRTPKEQEL
jgi:hypothetical protein